MLDRQGRLSMVRLALLGAVLGTVLIVGGIITLNSDQNSRRTPLIVEPYPGAVLWGEAINESPTNVRFFLRVPNVAADQVMAYYQQKLTEFAADERCVRTPATGSLPVDPSLANSVPFRYDCLFDRSGRGATQYTRITIFPETPAMDPSTSDDAINTIVNYQQVWQP